MNSVVYSLFISLALRVTVITAFVMLIKIIFRHKLSASAHCAIWCIPVVQIIFCMGNVSIPAKTSIYNVVSDVAASAGTIAAQPDAAHVDIRNIIALIYCLGASALAVWYLSVFLIHRYKTSKLGIVSDKTSVKILSELRTMLGIRDEITLRRGDFAQTVRKTVIIPDGYSPEEQRQIMLHELCHYKNKDNLKLLVGAAAVCLNWFNPIVWIAFRKFRSDIEMCCDDNVMKLTESKKGYAMVLVKSASDHARFIPGATGVSDSKNEIARRVKRIASWKKKKPVWLVAAVCACVTVSCLCLTDAVSNAVENTVDVTSTPEPVEVVPAIIDTVTSQGEQEPVSEPEAAERASEQPAYEASVNMPEQNSREAETAANTVPEQSTADTGYTEQAQTVPEYTENDVEASYAVPTEAAEAEAVTESAAEAEAEAPSEDIYSSLGEPESVSANGNKETYSLGDGRTAVLHYDDGELETGYIINGGETSESAEGSSAASDADTVSEQ